MNEDENWLNKTRKKVLKNCVALFLEIIVWKQAISLSPNEDIESLRWICRQAVDRNTYPARWFIVQGRVNEG